jgi:hypothetical protein
MPVSVETFTAHDCIVTDQQRQDGDYLISRTRTLPRAGQDSSTVDFATHFAFIAIPSGRIVDGRDTEELPGHSINWKYAVSFIYQNH